MVAMLRRAERNDLPSIATLTVEVHRLHFNARPDYFCADDQQSLESNLVQVFEDSSAMFWVIEELGEVVAYTAVRVRQTEAGPYTIARTWWEVDQLCVAASQRKRGLGRTLMTAIADEAKRAGVPTLELACWSFNQDAQRAFARLGFVPKVTRFELSLSAERD